MSEGTDRNHSPSDRDRQPPHADRPSLGTTRLSRIRSLTEELGRRHPQRIQTSTSGTASSNRPPGEWILAYDSGARNVLPPIDDLMSAEEHSRSTGYRRPDQSSSRGNRDILISAILPPLPDNSDEAMDIEMNNQRMDETNDDSATTRRRVPDMPRPFAVRDLEGLLGDSGRGDDDDLDFTRARFPSQLRHSATATSENPPADARNERDMDPNERRWLDMLYMRMPPASSTISPHIQALLSRRAADGGRLDAPGRDALWNLMLEEDGSDEGEDDESEWERTSSPAEISHRGVTRNAAELLAELHAAAGGAPPAPARSVPLPSLVPSRPATNAHLRGTHAPNVVGSSNRITSHTRTTGRDQESAGRGESNLPSEESASGASLRRRKSIKRRRIESGMDISYPYPIMTSANSEPIPNTGLPEYMQMANTPILAIPTTFNPLDKCSRLTISPSTSSDIGYGPLVAVKFIGTGARGDADAAAVRTDHPIPPTCGIYYYEATIISKGKDGYISIGLSNRFINLSRLVGWEPGSYAWHMDDGFVFEGRGEGTSKGWPTSTTGDVIGCGVDFTTGKAFFTKNGQMVGHAFKNIAPADKLYPSIGLRTSGETVQCNFTGPFKYDIVTHVRQVKRDLLNTILRKDSVNIKADVSTGEDLQREHTLTPIAVSGKSSTKNTIKKATTSTAPSQQVIRNIDGALAPAVLSYLQHNGFFGSAAAMRKDMSSRKRLLDTGVEDFNSARHQKIAKTEKWYETQEDSWRQLQNVKRDYQENRLSKVWDTLRDNVKPSIAYPHFLDSFDALWSCRIRTRYFLKIVSKILVRTDYKGAETVDQTTVNLPELKQDPDFKTFVLGDLDLSGLLQSQMPHEFDASSVLLALGQHMRNLHGADVIDAQLINLLRSSQDSFVAKLVSGPSIAAQGHPLDEHTIVQAQVSIMPLRQPSAHTERMESTLNPGLSHPVTTQINATLSDLLESLDAYKLWNVICIRPNESGHPNSIEKRRVKMQIRSLLLPDRVARQQVDYVADVPLFEFAQRHRLAFSGEEDVAHAIHAFAQDSGWIEGQHFAVGRQSVWLSFDAWKQTEDMIRAAEHVEEDEDDDEASPFSDSPEVKGLNTPYGSSTGHQGQAYGSYVNSAEDLLIGKGQHDERAASSIWNSEYDKGTDRDMHSVPVLTTGSGYPDEKPFSHGSHQQGDMIVNEKKRILAVEVAPPTRARVWWLRLTWALTFWIPSFLLSSVGRMKRADVRIAWREKTAICMLIFGLCGVILFYIIVFGRLICPDKDKAWSEADLGTHTGTNDYYAAIQGQVYDFTKFYKGQHSDLKGYDTSSAIMLQFAGLDLTNYFPPPLNKACPGLVNSSTLVTQYANFTPTLNYAIHYSGAAQSDNDTKLDSEDWYYSRLQPFLKEYRKGWLVYKSSTVQQQAEDSTRYWAIYKGNVYDLSNYLYTADYYSSSSGTDLPNYSYLNSDLTDLIKGQPGSDLTDGINKVLDGLSESDKQAQLTCLNNAFYQGRVDFRDDAKCLFPDYLLLAFAVVIMSTVLAKFIAALQLGSKRSPELQDKFVLCQVPCYSEGEDSMRKTIDSLASLKYDDKRKLIFIICDGNIVGSGNDRPTPRIVLDILGVDPNLDPEPLMFKSVGEGGAQLNYAKVYSGLYEFEGHVVPYMVVVKVGRPSETSKPGNRGKRDSQCLLLHYLNRVHFDAPMSPLELEIYHQMRNVIGIDPAFYEYIFQVDADTTASPESLNRMIASCADDSSIIGICGETKLENPKESFTTMIQVYEYYISHHLTKAFESLFGSVTCLPGCFSVYRIRTADKGRPVIISTRVIDEYSEIDINTLHKKNLFSLGEDRYLTTLMMKHFPTFKMKFTPDAVAHTIAPSSWTVLLSQRRRWINSTIHNLVELLRIDDMCGWCCFSMRFIVFLDLLGTLILPATCVYLTYLIITVSTGKAAVPIISLAMIAAVYGLQALIFILKREFMLIGWMVVYILAYPIFNFALPVYSFWRMDSYSWGQTRTVEGEGKNKKMLVEADDYFEESMIPLKRFQEYERETWEAGSATGKPEDDQADQSSVTGSVVSHGGRSRLSRRPPPGGEHSYDNQYWQDANPLRPESMMGSNRIKPAESAASLRSSFAHEQPRSASMAGMSQFGGGGSAYGGYPASMPFGTNPFMPGAAPSSEYGGHMAPMQAPNMLGMNPFAPAGSPMMSPYNPFGPGSIMNGLAQSVNPFANPQQHVASPLAQAPAQQPIPNEPPTSYAADPTDDELFRVVDWYVRSNWQDDSITRKKVRLAVFAKFPEADLVPRTQYINDLIDRAT